MMESDNIINNKINSSSSSFFPSSSSNIISEKNCRICFEEEEIYPNILFSPCNCKGSQKYVHIDCLNEFRKQGK